MWKQGINYTPSSRARAPVLLQGMANYVFMMSYLCALNCPALARPDLFRAGGEPRVVAACQGISFYFTSDNFLLSYTSQKNKSSGVEF
jgi:hypothetical protein